MSKPQKTRFEYKPRDKVAVQKRATQSGGLFDSIFRNDFTVWKPKDGDNRIRFLPPTWPKPEHFGLDIYVHFGIGSDSQSYLCLEKMKDEPCPICAEKRRADKSGDTDYARELSATKRVLVWMIDRDDEESGPQLWSMPWTVDRDFAALSIDKRTREILFLDSPEEGFDIEFTKTGSKLKTKYIGAKVDRRPSPLSDDDEVVQEWMQFIEENPLTNVLQYFDAEHISQIAAGKKNAKDEEDEDEDEAPRAKKRPARDEEEDEEEEKPHKKSKPVAEEEDEDDRPTQRPPSKTTSRSRDEDEDEDDEKPRKKSRASESEDEDEFDCVACSDTGKNSKGGYCVCAKGRKLKSKAEQEEEDEDEDDRPTKAKARSRLSTGVTKRTGREDEEDEDEDEAPRAKKRPARDEEED